MKKFKINPADSRVFKIAEKSPSSTTLNVETTFCGYEAEVLRNPDLLNNHIKHALCSELSQALYDYCEVQNIRTPYELAHLTETRTFRISITLADFGRLDLKIKKAKQDAQENEYRNGFKSGYAKALNLLPTVVDDFGNILSVANA